MSDTEMRETLLAFFDAMENWESETRLLYRRTREGTLEFDEFKARSLQSLQEVFRQFCTTWDRPARARYGAPNISTIPTYGRERERIMNIEGEDDIVRVVTQQTGGPRDQFVYRLEKTGDGWRIRDNRKRISNGEEVDWDL